jgi:anti-sigma factor RsiW
MTEHPDLLLSAYLDDALTQGEHYGVRAHLDGCARCAGRLAELRTTSRLIAALPTLAPGRSLVPRLGRAPVWLRPVRLLGAMGSGLFVFLFLASAVLNSGSSLGGGTTTSEQLASKGQFGAAANAIASDAAARKAVTPDAAALPSAAPVAPAAQLPVGAPAPAATPLADSARNDSARNTAASVPSQSPVGRADSASTAELRTVALDRPQVGPPPQAFLAIALLCALVAFVAHRRLRRS